MKRLAIFIIMCHISLLVLNIDVVIVPILVEDCFVWFVVYFVRVEKFMPLLGSNWFICLDRSLSKDKYMRYPISQFSPKVDSIALPCIHTNLCFNLGQIWSYVRVIIYLRMVLLLLILRKFVLILMTMNIWLVSNFMVVENLWYFALEDF
jgi:hypothetical protein